VHAVALLALGLALAAALAGCGLSSGAGGTSVRVLVTRDFGTKQVGARIYQDLPSSDTATHLLARDFHVAAGRGRLPAGWFLAINGIGSQAGAVDATVHDGDAIWWDRHDSSATRGVPAVVGSFPEPFAHGSGGKRYPVVLECADDVDAACTTASDRLGAVGAIAGRQALGTGVGQDTTRVFVGRWSELRGDPALALIDQGPAASGVYVRFSSDGRRMGLLDPAGGVVQTLGAGAGLVAATRFEQQAPTWVLTGTDVAGVAAAARALDERTLARRFALALNGSEPIGLPVVR